MSAFIRATSTSDFAVKGTFTMHSFDGAIFSSEAVFRIEFGMTISLPLRSRTMVCRQLMSLTVPVAPATLMKSPGWMTRPTISPKPPITLAMVSFRPRETARPPMPRAVNNVVGLTPNTGWSTVPAASTHTTTRMMLMKIEALGTCDLSSSLRAMRVSALSATNAMAMTMTSSTILP